MVRSSHGPQATERRVMRAITGLVVALIAGSAVVVGTTLQAREPSPFDPSLPNPMGGSARVAPGEATGVVSLAGLVIADAEVAMGAVALGVTYVPGWEVTNTTSEVTTFVAGQPQVLEGCCPGPIYADGVLIQAGQDLVVPPGGSVLLQFPLQMHQGMDGPHHLAIPLTAGGEVDAVHVTGDFSAATPTA